MNISVITPFYRGNSYMFQLFGSIRAAALAAPEVKVEFLLVNDSPDCPIVYDDQWVRGFELHILNNEVNCGIHGSRVRGLAHAQGEFVWFLDQDDLLSENAFRSMFSLSRDADVIVANGYDQNPKSPGPIYKTLGRQQAATQARFYYRLCNQIVSPGHCLLRRSAIPASWTHHIMSCNGSDDLLLWFLLHHKGCRWRVNPEMLYTHVDTGVNVSADVGKMVASSMEVLDILDKLELISRENRRYFLRSRSFAAKMAGAGKVRKLLTCLLYPDVTLEKLRLRRYKQEDRV